MKTNFFGIYQKSSTDILTEMLKHLYSDKDNKPNLVIKGGWLLRERYNSQRCRLLL